MDIESKKYNKELECNSLQNTWRRKCSAKCILLILLNQKHPNETHVRSMFDPINIRYSLHMMTSMSDISFNTDILITPIVHKGKAYLRIRNQNNQPNCLATGVTMKYHSFQVIFSSLTVLNHIYLYL